MPVPGEYGTMIVIGRPAICAAAGEWRNRADSASAPIDAATSRLVTPRRFMLFLEPVIRREVCVVRFVDGNS